VIACSADTAVAKESALLEYGMSLDIAAGTSPRAISAPSTSVSSPCPENAGSGTPPSALAAALPSIPTGHATEIVLLVTLSLLRETYSPSSLQLAFMAARGQARDLGISDEDFQAVARALLEFKDANRSPIEGMF
jgi:hypothetical protein